ncbi:MAG: hypothetical protein WBB07_28475 [Mycobacterium sp.]
MKGKETVFVGSQAVAQGRLTPYQLRTGYSAMFPNIYATDGSVPSLRTRTIWAWQWSRTRGVVAGLAAAALHGSDWVDDDVPVELIHRNTGPPAGIITRGDRLADAEITRSCGILATTTARTAFDLGRRLPRAEALGRLDALKRATAFSAEKVAMLGDIHPGARGLRQLRELLPLVDGGAASPKESWLRLVLLDDGLPRPTTQIAVGLDGYLIGILDMGWEQYQVAAEYDGDQHRTDRRQYVRDQRRLRDLARAGWIVVRVIAEDRPEDVLSRVRAALRRRGYRDT